MPIYNSKELQRHLNKSGTLSELLSPNDFADENLVADKMAQQFKKDLNPTQMRKIFHAFKRIQQKLKGKSPNEQIEPNLRAEISLIRPNLAYAVGRDLLPEEFYKIIKLCIQPNKLQTVQDIERLNQFLTAILAYQKYRSGKEKKND